MVVQNSGVRRNTRTRVGLVNTLAMAHELRQRIEPSYENRPQLHSRSYSKKRPREPGAVKRRRQPRNRRVRRPRFHCIEDLTSFLAEPGPFTLSTRYSLSESRWYTTKNSSSSWRKCLPKSSMFLMSAQL